MNISPFGNIDKDNLEEYYESRMQISGCDIEIDLNFDAETIDDESLMFVSRFIGKLELMAANAFQAVLNDFELGDKSEAAFDYWQHCIDELSSDELESLFGMVDMSKDVFFNGLSLYRVGLYPEELEAFAVFDIRLPEEYTDYLIAVTLDLQGRIVSIDMES